VGNRGAHSPSDGQFEFIESSEVMNTCKFLPLATLALCFGVLSSGFLASSANGQEWPKKMFEKLDHDFGTVARGSDTVYKFEVTNKFVEDIHISGVRSSCGCTSPSIENNTIKTYEKAYVVAKFNTRTFTGLHSATLTVSIDRPYPAQIQLRVHGNIRGDVVFEPGSVNFDTVDQGSLHEKKVGVTYAGRGGWEIKDVVSGNDSSENYEVVLSEGPRNGGLVKYDLTVRLKENTPAGYLKDQLILVTNDSRNPRIPLNLEGRILPEISVMPENWVLGEVPQGGEVTKKLIVRGKTDFTITKIECDEECFGVEFDPEPRKTHVVSVNFKADAGDGPLKKQIRIHTDRGETYTTICTAYATVTPATSPSEGGDLQPTSEGTSTAAADRNSKLADGSR